jgi:hypothetical protein
LLRRRFEQKAPAKETGARRRAFSAGHPIPLHAVLRPNQALAGYGNTVMADNLAASSARESPCLRIGFEREGHPMRASVSFASIGLIAVAAIATTAWAASFDGTYVGKSRMTGQSYSTTGAAVSCKREYDIRITITGNTLTGENLSIGGKATGTVQSDGSFFAQGGLAVQTQATIQGKIANNVIRGSYTQVTRNATCTGTIQATRK